MTRNYAVVVLLALVSLRPGVTAANEPALQRQIEVSWDFGSGPGRTSNLYVGKRKIVVLYDSQVCISRFTLERATFENSSVSEGGVLVSEGPPFIVLRFHKHFSGTFDLLPKVVITQQEVNKKGKLTGKPEDVVFPFRERQMAAPVPDWTSAEIEVRLGAPGEAMGLHNPLDWSGIAILCDPAVPK